MTSKGIKGFRVVKGKDGKTTLERIKFYGMDASAKIAQRNRNASKTRRRVKVMKKVGP
jgi:hypothetical protein